MPRITRITRMSRKPRVTRINRRTRITRMPRKPRIPRATRIPRITKNYPLTLLALASPTLLSAFALRPLTVRSTFSAFPTNRLEPAYTPCEQRAYVLLYRPVPQTASLILSDNCTSSYPLCGQSVSIVLQNSSADHLSA